MNMLYVFFGGIALFIFGLIIFGGPDVEEMQRKRAMKKNKTLVEKIISSTESKGGKSGGGLKKSTPSGLSFGMDTSSDTISETNEDGQKTKGGSKFSGAAGDKKSNPIPSGMSKTEYFESATSGGSASNPFDTTKPSAPATTSDGYYPPQSATAGKSSSGNNNKNENKSGGNRNSGRRSSNESTKNPTLSALSQSMTDPENGTRVTFAESDDFKPNQKNNKVKKDSVFMQFSGTKAYLVSSDGSKKAAPDGYYELPNENGRILIRGGNKVISN